MLTQLTFSDIIKLQADKDYTGEYLKEEGMEAAMNGAKREWKASVLKCIRDLAERMEVFTADDLAWEMEKQNVPDLHPNAKGGLINIAVRQKWMFRDGYTKSRIPKKHQRIMPIYRSLLFTNY